MTTKDGSLTASGSTGSEGIWACDWANLLWIGLIAGTVFFTNLGGAKLWDRDEPRNAGCAIEMLQRGDWVTPMFNAELRGQKPILTYWLMMSAMSVFGANEFAARFWSAALGVGTVLLTYLWVRQLFFAALARWAALILATSLMFAVASRSATPDAPLIFCSTLAVTLYVLWTFRRTAADRWEELVQENLADRLRVPGRWFPATGGALTIYAALGLGVLAKGPVAVVLPTLIIGLFILIESSRAEQANLASANRSWRTRLRTVVHRWRSVLAIRRFVWAVGQMQPWWLLLMVGVISLPWFVWVGLRTEGEFLRLFFLREHLERATTAMEGHRGGLWFYPVAIIAGVFPWSILFVPALLCWVQWNRAIGGDHSGRSPWAGGLTLALVWVGLQVAVFSLASTKLPSYVTPCYPAVAMLLAIVPWQLESNRLALRSIWLRGGFVTWLALGLAVSGALLYLLQSQLGWSAGWLPALGLVLILGGVVAWVGWERAQQRVVAKALMATSWLFIWLSFSFATTYVSSYRSTDDLWNIAAQHQGPGAVLASFRDLESTWVYYARQPIWELNPYAPSGSARPSTADPLIRDHWWSVKPRASVEDLVAHHPGSLIVTPEKDLGELLRRLPANYRPLATRPDFLTRSNLVLVGPHPDSPPAEEWRSAHTAEFAAPPPR